MKATAERRYCILLHLCKNRFDTLENLAVEFNVSKKTIQRDVELISGFAPIYTTSGKGGGIHIVDGFSATQTYLNQEQLELLQTLAVSLSDDKRRIIESVIYTFSVPAKK